MTGRTSNSERGLKNRTVLVTGGGSGIGALLAGDLAAAGARVFIAGRRQGRLDETVAAIGKSGASCETCQCDVTDAAAVQALFETVGSTAGSIDLLINCAGHLGPIARVTDVDSECWLSSVDQSLRAMFLPTHTALKKMQSWRKGMVITISSVAARNMPIAGISAYAAAKAAIDRLTECIAVDLEGTNVGICAIHPRPVRTAIFEALLDATAPVPGRPRDMELSRLNDWAKRIQTGGADGGEALTMLVRKLAASSGIDHNGRIISC